MSFRSVAAFAAFSLLSACGTGPDTQLGQNGATASVFGYAVADEPQAALVARQVLNEGGNAADAAAAAGFALSVTLPSRAGLGGGGACIVKMPPQAPVAILFPPGAPASSSGARPAAIPTMARGLLALQARYGVLPAASVIAPAERLAGDASVSPALESDLQVVGSALLDDPSAAAIFAPNGSLLPTGGNLVQPDLAATLEVLRTQDVQGFYAGGFAQQFVAGADAAGGGLSTADLDDATPKFVTPVLGSEDHFDTAMLPTSPADGQALPASAGFAVLDKNGGVVACTVTINNLFGTGRIATGTGVLLAASPRTGPTPQLAAGIAYQPGSMKFRAAATGTGEAGAADAARTALADALAQSQAQAQALVPAPGRANVISCPGGDGACSAQADPRGQGLAVGGP